jgi:hypothetical protein
MRQGREDLVALEVAVDAPVLDVAALDETVLAADDAVGAVVLDAALDALALGADAAVLGAAVLGAAVLGAALDALALGGDAAVLGAAVLGAAVLGAAHGATHARAIAASSGSGFMTMPGPPPYGLSSTVRCLSVVKSRGLMVVTVMMPASRARPTTPADSEGSTSSGRIVTTVNFTACSPAGRRADRR